MRVQISPSSLLTDLFWSWWEPSVLAQMLHSNVETLIADLGQFN